MINALLPGYEFQRGTGQPIPRQDVLVYDFMPVILGDQFRTDAVLSKMLLRPAPEDAPSMLQADAYETLGLRYVSKGELIPALECYRIALDSRTEFARLIRGLGEGALLSKDEIAHMEISTDLEKRLIRQMTASQSTHDATAYRSWVEELRAARKRWLDLNHDAYDSREYVEACLKVGEYQQALLLAEKLGDIDLIGRVRGSQPEEILAVVFLKQYIKRNFPKSSFGRG